MAAGGRTSSYIAVLAAFFGTLVALFAAPAHAQTSGCGAPANEIVAENCLAGSPPSEWEVQGAGEASIQGFATDISVDHGQTVQLKVDTGASDYRLDIYRMGWYGGDGARLVATVQPSASLPQNQPACLTDDATGLIDCGNWAVSASWSVPATAVSGIYFAKLVREDGTAGASHVPFIVRDDDGGSDLLFQTSDTTWQAYNQYGGNSLYVGGPGTNPGRAYKVSYNRPFTTRGTSPEDWVFNAEYPMVRFLERNGYDVSYFTGVDSDRLGAEIRDHRIFLSVGHDEYWSGGQRANVEAARDAGVNLAFFSGNEILWKTRWENDHRTLVSYKETHANAKIDPAPGVWTGTWRDPRFQSAGRRRPAGERAFGHDLHRQFRDAGVASAGRGRLPTVVARNQRCEPGSQCDRDARRRHRRLRVGRGFGQWRAPGGSRAPVLHDGGWRREAPGLRLDVRPRHRDASSHPVPRPERGGAGRPRLRCGHGAVVVGLGRRARPRQLHFQRSDPAGDGQSAGGHGGAARFATGRPFAREPFERHHATELGAQHGDADGNCGKPRNRYRDRG
jgi:hypothetical protein